MGQLSRDKVDYMSEIDDLFDETAGGIDDFEDVSISSCVYEPVLLGFKDKKLELSPVGHEARLEQAKALLEMGTPEGADKAAQICKNVGKIAAKKSSRYAMNGVMLHRKDDECM